MEAVKVFILPAVLAAVVPYLLGSVSFSILFTRLFAHHTDIRTLGSGNAGATNVLRSVGKLPALLTTLLDFGKGALSVAFGEWVFRWSCEQTGAPLYTVQYGAYIAGLACILGHIFPLYFGFRGGKGVLTCAAMMALIDWRVFLCCFGIFLLVFLCSRIVSLASIVGSSFYPLVTFLFTWLVDYPAGNASPLGVGVSTAVTFLVAVIIVGKHHENIARIRAGTEKKITIKKKNSAS